MARLHPIEQKPWGRRVWKQDISRFVHSRIMSITLTLLCWNKTKAVWGWRSLWKQCRTVPDGRRPRVKLNGIIRIVLPSNLNSTLGLVLDNMSSARSSRVFFGCISIREIHAWFEGWSGNAANLESIFKRDHPYYRPPASQPFRSFMYTHTLSAYCPGLQSIRYGISSQNDTLARRTYVETECSEFKMYSLVLFSLYIHMYVSHW